MEQEETLRIAILGANPIGLEATLYARYLGYTVQTYESEEVCGVIETCSSESMERPFCQNCSPLGQAALQAQDPNGQQLPAEQVLTGRQWLDGYLLPLSRSDLVVDSLRPRHTVLVVEYVETDETFEVRTRDENGAEQSETVDYVLDVRKLPRIGLATTPDEMTPLPTFAASNAEDYFTISAETFADGLEQIRHVFAKVGERDDLDVYRSFSK